MARRVQVAPRQAQPSVARQQPAPKAVVQAPPQAKAAPKVASATAPKQATAAPKTASGSSVGAIKAPMPGLIIDIKVKVGDTVKAGQVVAIMEAMKMENDLPSTLDGTIKEVRVQKGTQVSTGDVLIVIG
ncbi:MAG: biotin/lipoyl-binding protein [Desulfamplus sp.]|nr:biotin/lipoyl-binding protein [Desulfamplus sp.]